MKTNLNMYKRDDILYIEGALFNYYAKMLIAFGNNRYKCIIIHSDVDTGINGVEFDILNSDIIRIISEEEYLTLQVLNE